MSLGSRIVRRGRVSAFANLASAPREPLLFLYPSWIRNSSTASKPGFSSSIPSATHTNPDHLSHDSGLKGGATEKHLAEAGSLKHRSNELARDESHFNDLGFTQGIYDSRDKDNPNECQVNNVMASVVDKPPKTKPLIRKLLQSNLKIEQTIARRNANRSAHQEERKNRTASWNPDWRVVLSDLLTNTPKDEKWLDKALNIIEPDDNAVSKFLDGVDSNIWDIAERHGSSVTLGSLNGQRGGLRSYFLSGPATAIRNTTLDLLRVAPNVTLKTKPNNFVTLSDGSSRALPNNEIEGPERSNLTRNVKSVKSSKVQMTRADKVPMPAEWTPRSFVDFVTDLTTMKMPNHVHRMLYKPGESHNSMVMAILRTIFLDPHCKSSISRTAFNTAMVYLVKINQIEELRRLFVHMEMMNVPPDAETFNIMLRGAAKAEDVHVFHFVLHLMLRRGISPNSKTWMAFMMTVPDLSIKLYILSAMRERGLLHHHWTMGAVCSHLVSYEIDSSLQNGLTQEEFLSHMDSRYGPKWLDVSNSHRILNAFGAKGLVSRCWEFLRIMKSRFVEPNAVTISTILIHCKHSTNVRGAIEIMRDLSLSTQSILDERTYHYLFEIAWRSRFYNLARVVWKYACLNGCTTRTMRTRVQTSLLAAATKTSEGTHSRQRWDQQAGLVITGNISSNGPPVPRVVDGVERSTLDIQPKSDHSSSSEIGSRRQAIRTYIEEECSAFNTWRPMRPFSELLVEAWERDVEWKDLERSEEPQGSWSLSWKLERVVTVPVRDWVTHTGHEVGFGSR